MRIFFVLRRRLKSVSSAPQCFHHAYRFISFRMPSGVTEGYGAKIMYVFRKGYNPPGYKWDFPLDGTKLDEGLDLTGIPLGKMGKGITIDGDLILKDTGLKELPEQLIVTGDLDITGTEVTSIPADAKIGGKIIGLPRRTV